MRASARSPPTSPYFQCLWLCDKSPQTLLLSGITQQPRLYCYVTVLVLTGLSQRFLGGSPRQVCPRGGGARVRPRLAHAHILQLLQVMLAVSWDLSQGCGLHGGLGFLATWGLHGNMSQEDQEEAVSPSVM